MENTNLTPVEVVSNSALAVISKSEIDCQIATAHAYPRSLEHFKKRSIELATIDKETAASCIYRRPVGKNPDGSMKYAEGLSVRMAEIVGASYGNLRVGAMIVEMSDRHVKARGYAHDLETNFASTSEIVESTVKRDGKSYDERMRIVIAKAAIAKARRDATFSVVPKALCRSVEIAARATAIGDSKTLEERRKRVMEWLKSLSIDLNRVFRALGVPGEGDLGLDELETLTGLKTALNDNEITLEEAFPSDFKESEPKKEDKNDFRIQKSYQKLKESLKSSWRDVEVHWGSAKMPIKGRTLGDICQKDSNWFHFLRCDWEPKPFNDKLNIQDVALRAALDVAHEEYEESKKSTSQPDAQEDLEWGKESETKKPVEVK